MRKKQKRARSRERDGPFWSEKDRGLRFICAIRLQMLGETGGEKVEIEKRKTRPHLQKP